MDPSLCCAKLEEDGPVGTCAPAPPLVTASPITTKQQQQQNNINRINPICLGFVSTPGIASSGHKPSLLSGGVGVPDGVVPDGVVPDGVVPDGVVPDGVVPDGVVPDGVVPDGVVPDGVVPDGVVVGVVVILSVCLQDASICAPVRLALLKLWIQA